jgi:HD-GYP domain-containing protein (c-di-GMP phosphodiesterase class II)
MTERRIRLQALGLKGDKNNKWEADRVVRIGRVAGLEVVLDDTSVSRRHAEIAFTDHEWVARDLGSTNGTFLNGARLGRAGQAVRSRDLLQCGNIVLTVEVLTDEPLDFTDHSSGNIQVQAVAQQSLEEAASKLVNEVTQSTRPGEQLLSLLRAGQFLDLTDSLDELLLRNLQDIVTSLGARRGSVVLIDAKSGKMSLRATYPQRLESGAGHLFSKTMAKSCFRRGQSLLCADIIKDPEMMLADSVNSMFMSSMICALLRSPQRYLGILQLDRGCNDEPFTSDDLHRADALAANMSFAFESAHQLQERQHALFIQTVIAFSQVIEMRDPYTGGHAQRVTDYALLLAEEMNLSETDRHHLRIGSPLHDIGKIGIDDAILRKTERLTPEEFEHMKSHTVKGAALLQTLPGLDIVLPIVRNHHERWDGGGYPDRLAADAIPHLARLMAVVDTFDAMTTDRPYRVGMQIDEALVLIEGGAGTQFDPQCVEAFVRLRPVLQQQLNQYQALSQTMTNLAEFLPNRFPSAHARGYGKQLRESRTVEYAATASGVLAKTL